MLAVRGSSSRRSSLVLLASLAGLLLVVAVSRSTSPNASLLPDTPLVLRSPAGPAARFVEGRAELAIAGRPFSLATHAITRDGQAPAILEAGASRRIGDEVQTSRGPGIVEWWKSLARGLEHGVTLTERPSGEGELVVELALGGALSPRLEGAGVALIDDTGRTVAHYGELVVLDARGRTLPSSMRVMGDRIQLAFTDVGARYPVVVDPMLYGEEHAFEVEGRPDHAEFGRALAMSSDGSILAIGAPNSSNPLSGDSTDPGAVHVFERSGSTWSFRQTLVAHDGAIGEEFGASIAVSSDGGRIVVGAPHESDGTVHQTILRGAAYVFTRSGTSWSEEAQLLGQVRALGNDGAWFGTGVGISGDGATIAVGEPYTAGPNGTVYVFSRSGTTWTETGELYELTETGHGFGWAVAVSADGNRIAVGSPMADEAADPPQTQTGAAYVFTRYAIWQRELRISPSDAHVSDRFGWSIALDATGTRMLVGAFLKVESIDGAPVSQGAAYVFARGGTEWEQEAKLVPAERSESDELGSAVALSSDGSVAVIGAPGSTEDPERRRIDGAAWVFRRDDHTWEDPVRLVPQRPSPHVGVAVAASADGTRLGVGALGADDARDGAAWVFRLGADGLGCSDGAADCASGFCVDGVCCDAACGGGADECEACTAALTGEADGVCATRAIPACLPDAGSGMPDGGSVVPDAGGDGPDAGSGLPPGGGCGCAVVGARDGGPAGLVGAVILVAMVVRRRRRPR